MSVQSKQVRVFTAAFDPASVAAATTAEQAVAVPGARSGDVVVAIKPTLTAGLAVAGARVTQNNTVGITFANVTAAAIDPGNETYTFLCASV